MAGFGDGKQTFMQSIQIPGGGLMEIGEFTTGAADNTLRIPTTMTSCLFGIALGGAAADYSSIGWADVTSHVAGGSCASGGFVDFCVEGATINDVVWNYVMFGF